MCGSPRALGKWHLGSLLAQVADKLFALYSTSGTISALSRRVLGAEPNSQRGAGVTPDWHGGVCHGGGTLCHHHTLRGGCSCSYPAVPMGHGTPKWLLYPHTVKSCLIKPLPCPWVMGRDCQQLVSRCGDPMVWRSQILDNLEGTAWDGMGWPG